MNTQNAENLQEAIRFLSEHPEAKIVAGGTDLIPRINQGIEEQDTLLFLNNIEELSGVKKNADGSVFLGALYKLVEITENPLLKDYTSLVQAAGKVASPQIRNQGTIGGNILQENRCMYFNQAVSWAKVERCFKLGGHQCYQYKNSPECVALFQSDLAPVLISYSATALVAGPEGEREIPISELYLKAGKKNINHNEILLGVKIPPIEDKWYSAYCRKTIRGSFDFPLLSCAVLIKENDGLVKDVKVVMGAAGVMPREVAEAKQILTGKKITELPEATAELEKSIKKYIAPFRDTRVNATVRRQMGEEVFIKAIEMIINK